MEPLNVFDYEVLAKKSLPPALWDYYQGGSEDEVTLRENRRAFERIQLRPRLLRDVSTVALQTTVLGLPVSMPLLVAPSAFHALAHPEGECTTARAVKGAGTLMVASTFASRSLEEIVGATDAPLWLQLYAYRNRQTTEALILRAEQAGYRAIVLTVDVPRLGRRERDMRHAFTLPLSVRAANFESGETTPGSLPIPSVVTWETVDWLHSITSLPVVLKGLLTAEDALLAVAHDVDGIIVSNHGGRQLDGALASIEALPEIVQAVAGRCEVYMDGGIRRGTDILKALALGARAVLVGRPVLWGLAVNGQAGVEHILELLRAELALALALSGCSAQVQIDTSLIKTT